MKKVVLVIILIANAICTMAQKEVVDSVKLNRAIRNSEYIFEGKVIDQCSYKTNDVIYTAHYIQLSRTFKGNLQSGIVTVITQGGSYENERLSVTHTVNFYHGFTGVFFCNTSPYGYESTVCSTQTNNINLTTTNSEHTEIEYSADGFNSIAQGLGCKFNSLQNVYGYIQYETKSTIIDFNQPHITQLYVTYMPTVKHLSLINHIEDGNNLREANNLTNNIKHRFTNGIITGVTTKYFECDVEIKANDSTTYFDQGAFRIKFNDTAFGTNIATATIVTLGVNFSTTTYPTITKINKQPNVVSIWVNSANYGKARTKITTIYQTLVHLKIPFISCAAYPTFTLDTFANILAYSTFASFATNPTIQTYSSIDLTATYDGTTCEPVVNKIYSLSTGLRSVAGGIKEQIKLEGVNFGPNNGKLFMRSTGDDIGKWLPLQFYDVNSWNDTAIVFTLPSLIDSTTYPTPGSGNVGVKNKWNGVGDTAFGGASATRLTVNYAVMNNSNKPVGGIYYKQAQILASGNELDSAYTFYLHTSVTDSMRKCISAAINKWRCFTGVNFKLATGTTTTGVASDNTCVIIVKSLLANDSTIAQTYIRNRSKICSSSLSTPQPFSTSEIDIEINEIYNNKFFYDTTGTLDKPANTLDFFSVILHELGHGHCLFHVKNKLDLMYYNSKFAPVLKENRAINFNEHNKTAGDWVIQHSTDLTPYAFSSTCGYNIPMAMQDTSCRNIANGLTTQNEVNYFVAFPNPTTGIITLNFTNESNWDVSIYNLQGQLIIETTNNHLKTMELNTDDWTKGIYLIKATNGIKTTHTKIICE